VADMLQYLKLVPGYAIDLIFLFSGPKRFLGDRNTANPENLTKALVFFLLSSAIALFFRAFGIESPTDFTTLLMRSVLAWGAALLAAAAVISASWVIVRKPVAIQVVLQTHAYILAVVLMIINIGVAAEANLLAIYRPELYNRVRSIYRAEQFDYGEVNRLTASHPLPPGDSVAVSMQAIQFLSLLAICVWVIATWGAYRRVAGASRARSALAFIVSFALFLPVVFVGDLITRKGYSLR
jgi:hypothetical protein